ncbi:hypothetical protein AB0P21_14565 [Kribbella sp. NPDC056861]|uniref:hypothetical protein n=1 Tax=Kribbella sp. NPDC056861 TaxID=3154857 RepID=UPI003412310F
MESDLWSMSCTPGEIAAQDFQGLSKRGLYLVQLDLTGMAGDHARLREVEVAVQTLRRTGILVEYELDLFATAPRFATVRDNVALLRAIVADGTTPATFTVSPRVGECSPWLAAYRERVGVAVQPWLAGLSGRLKDAWTEIVVSERRPGRLSGVAAHRIALQRLTLRSNTELLNLVADSAREYELTGDTQLLEHDLVAPRIALLTETLVALSNRLHALRPAALQQAG